MGTVDSWAERFGHLDPFEKTERRSFNWDFGVAYCCVIDKAQLTESKRGDKQIQLNLKVLDSDDEDATEMGRAVEYFTLPKQDSDLELDVETVKRIHTRRFLDVLRILSVGEPETFNLYKSVEGDGKQKIFIGYDDQPMTDKAFKDREASTHADCQLWVDDAHGKIGQDVPELAGGKIYISKVENKRSKKYPFTNVYANRPYKLPVYAKGEEAPF